MPVPVPSTADLASLAARKGLHLSEADLASFQGLIAATLGSYDLLDAMPQPQPHVRVPRTAGERPGPAENPLGAWYVRTAIKEAGGGPLAGRTVAIKDNICVAGVPMMNGSATLSGFVPDTDATVVTRVLDAGAEIIGKAVCEDLCFSGGSHTSATGPVRNPWDTSRTTGGSSSGCAALLAAGEVDLAIGGDQGGSVRIPAAFSGIVGLKPTHGLVPYTGAFPIEATIDHLGPMARTVRDAAVLLGVLAGADGLDPRQPAGLEPRDYLADLDKGLSGISVAVVSEGFGLPGMSEPGVDDAVRAAVKRMGSAGAKVQEVSIAEHRDGLHIWNVIAVEGAAVQMVD
ncbi:MAG: amidase family protein, partial [Acidimicrobiales bacterium]